MDFTRLKAVDLGKHFEHLLIAQLIKLEFDIFVPLADKGIDFIARKTVNGRPKYFEVQVKAVRRKGGRLTINPRTFHQHEGLFLFFFDVKNKEDYDAYVIPSTFVCNGKDKDGKKVFEIQQQKEKDIYRLSTTESGLKKIERFSWDFKALLKGDENPFEMRLN